MIWIGLLILAAVIVVSFEVYALRSQIAGVGRLLYGIATKLDDANELLREIANDTDKLPKMSDPWEDELTSNHSDPP